MSMNVYRHASFLCRNKSRNACACRCTPMQRCIRVSLCKYVRMCTWLDSHPFPSQPHPACPPKCPSPPNGGPTPTDSPHSGLTRNLGFEKKHQMRVQRGEWWQGLTNIQEQAGGAIWQIEKLQSSVCQLGLPHVNQPVPSAEFAVSEEILS